MKKQKLNFVESFNNPNIERQSHSSSFCLRTRSQ